MNRKSWLLIFPYAMIVSSTTPYYYSFEHNGKTVITCAGLETDEMRSLCNRWVSAMRICAHAAYFKGRKDERMGIR